MPRTSSYGKQSKQATIWWSEEADVWAVDTPYRDDWPDQIKTRTGRTSRWDPQRKLWHVKDPYIDVVKELCKEMFGDYLFMPRTAPSPAIGVGGNVYKDFVLCFTRDELNTAYRKAQQRVHPDRGGDPAVAAKLNQLWDEVQKELK